MPDEQERSDEIADIWRTGDTVIATVTVIDDEWAVLTDRPTVDEAWSQAGPDAGHWRHWELEG